tara:strand:- start:854 stop:1147 length:294 start_codon:yes stop_codon:yes gene_type:complete
MDLPLQKSIGRGIVDKAGKKNATKNWRVESTHNSFMSADIRRGELKAVDVRNHVKVRRRSNGAFDVKLFVEPSEKKKRIKKEKARNKKKKHVQKDST